MYMRNIQKAAIAAVAALSVPLLMTTSSCSTDVFDQDEYDSIVKFLSPVDSVDVNHTWNLTTIHTYNFTATGGHGATELMVFTDNPVQSKKAQLVARSDISDGQQVSLSVSVPSIQEQLFAVLADAAGNYYVTPFSTNAQNIDFSQASDAATPVKLTHPYLAYTYLFEESMPQPDDYDYNDVVMQISQERTGKIIITLRVTLAAVGADGQMGAAIRLIGYNYSDIEKVTTEGNVSFNDNVPKTSKYYFDGKTDLLLKGHNDAAIVNLFQDAHWSIQPDEKKNDVLYNRRKFNVTEMHTPEASFTATRTVTYHIYFKSEEKLNDFTLDTLDPFVVKFYNNGSLEIHTYEYRDAQCMYDYSLPTTKDLPWALKVPYTEFRHTLEGTNLGFKKKGYMFGAYMTAGHSFGEWCEDYTRTLDWYLYPTLNMVY
jgi:LruC domain-containing protein